MAVKIKLKRLGKVRNPQYRIVVADSRTKRGGRSIEEIGLYHPKEDPSRIEVDSGRVQYWLGVGAQPTDPVLVLLKITGDWQRFKGLPGEEGTLQVAAARTDKKAAFAEAAKAAADAKDAPAAPAPESAPAAETPETTPAPEAAAEAATDPEAEAPAVDEAPAADDAAQE